MPGIWNGYESRGKKLPGIGFATYRLQVILRASDESLSFKLPEILTAYTMYVNGKKLTSNGSATMTQETTVPQFLPHVKHINPDNKNLEIIFQISNFHHAHGGPIQAIQLGSQKEIVSLREKNLALSLLTFGCLMIMGIYHVVLFLLRRKEPSPIYLAAFCILIGTRSLTRVSLF